MWRFKLRRYLMFERPKYGTVEGTGAVIAIDLGFKPRVVKIFNVDGKCTLEWNEAMGAGKGYKVLTGIDSTADTVSLHSFISSGGITPSIGGFSIGADTDINVEAETICYEAW